MQPINYNIDQPRIDILGTIQGMQQIKANKQQSALNKMAMEDQQFLRNALPRYMQSAQGDPYKAEEMALSQWPEHAEGITRAFGMIKGVKEKNAMAPLEMQAKQNELAGFKQKSIKEVGSKLAKTFESLDDMEKQVAWPEFLNAWQQNKLDVPEHWRNGYSPKVKQELGLLSGLEEQKAGMTFEQKLELQNQLYQRKQGLQDQQYKLKTEFDQTKDPLRKAQLKVQIDKLNLEKQKFTLDEKQFGLDVDKQGMAKGAKALEYNDKIDALDASIDQIEFKKGEVKELLDDPNLWKAVGTAGWANFIKGTEAANIKSKIASIVDYITFENYAGLKARGVTLGATSENEMKMLKQSVANLDLSQDEKQFKKNLLRVYDLLDTWQTNNERSMRGYAKESKNLEKGYNAEDFWK
jgi:hypothetical protein